MHIIFFQYIKNLWRPTVIWTIIKSKQQLFIPRLAIFHDLIRRRDLDIIFFGNQTIGTVHNEFDFTFSGGLLHVKNLSITQIVDTTVQFYFFKFMLSYLSQGITLHVLGIIFPYTFILTAHAPESESRKPVFGTEAHHIKRGSCIGEVHLM